MPDGAQKRQRCRLEGLKLRPQRPATSPELAPYFRSHRKSSQIGGSPYTQRKKPSFLPDTNYGGYWGHTFFIVDNPAGGYVAYDFWSTHWYDAPGELRSLALALTADRGYVGSFPVSSLGGFLDELTKDGSDVSVDGIALGTVEDDAEMIKVLEAHKEDSGTYSILLGEECHSRAMDWFNIYKAGGMPKSVSDWRFLRPACPVVALPSEYWQTPAYVLQPIVME